MKILIGISILLLSLNTFAGAESGGGGGGFCLNGKCITLAEAGFRIKSFEEINKPVISAEAFSELESILRKVFLVEEDYDAIWGNIIFAENYKYVESYDANVMQKYKDEYIKILKESNFPSKNFELFGLSSSGAHKITYLFPKFYDMDAKSQALFLIHEFVVRMTGNIETALVLDGTVLDILSGNYSTIYRVGLVLREVAALGFRSYWENDVHYYIENGEYYKRKFLENSYLYYVYGYNLTHSSPFEILDMMGLIQNFKNNLKEQSYLYSKSKELFIIFQKSQINSLRFLFVSQQEQLKKRPDFVSLCAKSKDEKYFIMSMRYKNDSNLVYAKELLLDSPIVVHCKSSAVYGVYDLRAAL